MRGWLLFSMILSVGCVATGEEPDLPPAPATRPAVEGGALPQTSFTEETEKPPVVPTTLSLVGSLVVLGDAIGDGGGAGPFYYDLLRKDLDTKYGVVAYVNNAAAGSRTNNLAAQVDALPATLPSPVVVVITSGINDMRAVWPKVTSGDDGDARTAMRANVRKTLDRLLAPGRFGGEVRVYFANLYDSSDGRGDFGTHGCGFGTPLILGDPSDDDFARWNADLAKELSTRAYIADFHKVFRGHGYSASTSWFAGDCISPNKNGHDAIRRYLYEQITGGKL
jgi:hypothetical protein